MKKGGSGKGKRIRKDRDKRERREGRGEYITKNKFPVMAFHEVQRRQVLSLI